MISPLAIASRSSWTAIVAQSRLINCMLRVLEFAGANFDSDFVDERHGLMVVRWSQPDSDSFDNGSNARLTCGSLRLTAERGS